MKMVCRAGPVAKCMDQMVCDTILGSSGGSTNQEAVVGEITGYARMRQNLVEPLGERGTKEVLDKRSETTA